MEKHKLPLVTGHKDVTGKQVILRSSLNVPIKNGEIENSFRLTRAKKTLSYLSDAGAKIVLIGHIGRDPKETLRPVYDVLSKSYAMKWSKEITGDKVTKLVSSLSDGEVLMLENLRSHEGERDNDPLFAKELSELGELYVNDAFSVSHRSHASIVGIPNYVPSCVGLTFKKEYEELTRAMTPSSPSLFIIGGAKFETKLPLIEAYTKIYDHVFVGGALANDFLKAKGFEIGSSVISGADMSGSSIFDLENVLVPTDVTVAKNGKRRIASADAVKADESIFDIGPETMKALEGYISEAKMILWNGPLGYYEGGYDEYTKKCAELVAKSKAYSVVGGGDTVAVIEPLTKDNKFGFLSTAGGAMLEYLQSGTLPGIDALQ